MKNILFSFILFVILLFSVICCKAQTNIGIVYTVLETDRTVEVLFYQDSGLDIRFVLLFRDNCNVISAKERITTKGTIYKEEAVISIVKETVNGDINIVTPKEYEIFKYLGLSILEITYK